MLSNGLVRERAAVESCLALGGTRSGRARGAAKRFDAHDQWHGAIGLVSLPGMMTGQILAGVEPVDAVKYPLMIMFLIASGTGLGTLAGVLGRGRLLTDHRHRLRLDRITVDIPG